MKTIFKIVVIIFCFALKTNAQELKLENVGTVKVSGNYMTADNLGYIYIVNGSTLQKFDTNGIILFTYTELSDGKISGIDVSDPLKIMIFNSDFGKIKFLDNKLSLKKDFILLSDLGYQNATLACLSYENGFWLYDPMSNQIVRFQSNLKQSQSSESINNIAQLEIAPVFMCEINNTLYLYDPNNGILMFDRYATYMHLWPFKEIHSFQVFPSQLLLGGKNEVRFFDIKTFEESAISIPEEEEIINAVWNNQRLYILTKTSLNIYKILK